MASRLRVTFRGAQIALGCLWLLDGLLQFQSFMYTHAFLTQVIEPSAQGSPSFIAGPILTVARFYGRDQVLWNTLAAELQCAIGLGLIVGGRMVRPALLVSIVWALSVWWFGEGFGMLFSGTPVSPLMGAPGAVVIYVLVGMLVWPRNRRRDGTPAGFGLLGRRGGDAVWSLVWLEAGVLWFLNVDRSPGAIHDQISAMARASPAWLATLQTSVANAAQGHGVPVATVLGVVSVAVAIGVWSRLRTTVLALGVLLSLAYWVLGQSAGGPFWIGNATDVNAGPLFALLAVALIAGPRATPAAATSAARAPAGRVNATA